MRLITIRRQEILQDITLFTSQPKAKFYDALFLNLDVSELESATPKTGRKGFSSASMLCAFLVMKLERFSQITDLADYLENNKLIAYYCGFDITRNLPSYWTYDRFIQNLDHALLEKVMQKQVLQLVKMGYIYIYLIYRS